MSDEKRGLAGLFRRSNGESAPAGSPTDPEAKPPRLVFADPADEARRRVLVFLLGVPSTDFDRLLDLAGRALDKKRDLPVFVVTTLDFAPLRDRGAIFEYAPSAADLGSDEPEAFRGYFERRLAIIRLKWDAAAEIDFGLPVETFIEQSLGSAADQAKSATGPGSSADLSRPPVEPID